MGKKLKVIGLALVVVCAFGVASASASAAIHWNVGGSELTTGSEAVSETVTLEETELEGGTKNKAATLTVTGLLRLSCTGLKIEKGKIIATSTDSASALVFTGCVVQSTAGVTQAGCTVKSEGGTVGTIKTSTGNTSALKAVGSKAYDVFTPESGTNFATVVIAKSESGSCALSGTNKVTGTAALELEVGTNNAALKGVASAATASAAGTALKYGERAAILDGHGSLTLTSGKTWGVGL